MKYRGAPEHEEQKDIEATLQRSNTKIAQLRAAKQDLEAEINIMDKSM